MQIIIKGPSDKPCVVCGKGDTRKVVVREEDFQGPLCREHVWTKSGPPQPAPIEKKESTNGERKTPAGSSA